MSTGLLWELLQQPCPIMSWCWGLLLPRDKTSPSSLLNCERFPLAQLSSPSEVPLDGSTTPGYQLLLPVQPHLPPSHCVAVLLLLGRRNFTCSPGHVSSHPFPGGGQNHVHIYVYFCRMTSPSFSLFTVFVGSVLSTVGSVEICQTITLEFHGLFCTRPVCFMTPKSQSFKFKIL